MPYFDHNATTPLDPRVADLLDHANREFFGNASSVHIAGQVARQKLELSRREIAPLLGVAAAEIVFTSGGTESNNHAIRGALRPGAHAITSLIEHPSVLEPFRQLEKEGVKVTYLPVDANGEIAPADVEKALRPQTALVSFMIANNETGVVQPVAEIAAIIKRHRSAGAGTLLHCDGVQAAGKLPLDLRALGADLVSISGHKLHAPKGIGALYVRKGVKLQSLHWGGRHEHGFRAGTENVPGALALAKALEFFTPSERDHLRDLRDAFERKVLAAVPDARINSSRVARLPNTSNVFFPEINGEALLIALDMRGMCVSTGSACSSGSLEPSPVLLAMGLSPMQARSCIRFSFGRGNTMSDIESLVDEIGSAVHRMRENQLV